MCKKQRETIKLFKAHKKSLEDELYSQINRRGDIQLEKTAKEKILKDLKAKNKFMESKIHSLEVHDTK